MSEADKSQIEERSPEQDDAPAPEPQVIEQSEPPRQSVFPLVVGGALAGLIGMAAAYVYLRETGTDYQSLIEAQAAEIAALKEQVAALPTEQADLGPISSELETLSTGLTTGIDGLRTAFGDDVAALEARLSELERAPEGDGTLSETAIAAWQAELDSIRAEFSARQDEMETLTNQAQADLEAARAEAEAIELSAEEAERIAVARAALGNVRAALNDGAPFAQPLAALEDAGVEIPAALSTIATDGAPSLTDIQDAFPGAARAALSAARAEGLADSEVGAFTAFVRNQFDVRSVEPREGEDPDAILSRTQAAVSDNRLTDAIAEVETLPEVVRAEMSDWIRLATARSDAFAAVDTLDAALTN